MEKVIKCLLCEATAIQKTDKFPGYCKPTTFSIYHCESCNTSFSMPRTDATEIYNLIYKNAAKVAGYDRYWRYKNTVKTDPDPLQFLYETEETYWSAITALEKAIHNKPDAKILEVGCGMGYLTYSLIKSGYNAVGLDISQQAIDEANRFFGNYYVCADIFEYAKQHKGEYDVVIMTEVIEHVEEPVRFLENATQLLKKNGTLIVTTPNKTIYSNDIIWNTDLPPIHCWWFSEKSMALIAEKINCNVSFIDFSKYYKQRKPSYIAITKQSSTFHRFDENNNVITNIEENATFCKFIKNTKIFKRIQSTFCPKILLRCKQTGNFICAVYKRNTYV